MEHIHPLEPIAVIVLIVVFLYLRRRKAAGPAKASPVKESRSEPRTIVLRSGPPRVQEPPEEIFMKMRQQAIETGFATLSLAGPRREDEPYGVVMEMGISSPS